MKHCFLFALPVLALISLFPQFSFGSHIMGGEITYECVDSCTYRIFRTTYFDCLASGLSGSNIPIDTVNPNPPGWGNLSSTGFIGSTVGGFCTQPTPVGNWQLESWIDVTLLCPGTASSCMSATSQVPGIAAATWSRAYDLCPLDCDEYMISFSDCCRNFAITSGAAGEAIAVVTKIFTPEDSMCNASPKFIGEPAAYICQNSLTSVPMGAVDPEGDSLVYSLVQCLDGFNAGGFVSYNAGFSPTAPLGPNWTVNLNPTTGWLTVTPGPNASLEVGVMCVQVDEYRNGVHLGQIIRDIQITVVSCNPFSQGPVIQPIQLLNGGSLLAADTLSACPGTPLQFQLTVQDPDTNEVMTLISSATQVLSGATSTLTGSNPAVLEVTWTPDSADLNQGYEFFLTAYDETCPYPMYAYQSYFVDVSGPCVGAFIINTQCSDSIGEIDLTVAGGNSPFTYTWNTGANTEDLSDLPAGMYWVDILDANNNPFWTDTFYVFGTDFLFTPTYTDTDCNGTGGGISVQVSGGTAPYSYLWNTGAQQSQLTGLGSGGYSVIVTDADACIGQEVFFLYTPDSCEVLIEGTAYYDLNANCVQDPGEAGIPFLYIEATPGGATFTDFQGNYSILVDTGNISLDALPAPGIQYPYVCPINGQHALYFAEYSDDTIGVDFAIDAIPAHNLAVSTSILGNTVPGFGAAYSLTIQNLGTIPLPPTVEFALDPDLSFLNTSLLPVLYDPLINTLQWQLDTLAPGMMLFEQVLVSLDTNAVVGSLIQSTASIYPIIGDVAPNNNQYLATSVVVASFDPNDKRVSPAGFGPEGFIEASENDMHYSVRFQNTGNYPAQFVVIRDTIDANLNLSSYRPATQSHPYTLNVEEDSILVFTFADINLPDSASDPLGSQGEVSFRLMHADTLQPGDQIRNSVGIYFDFNAPIQTNEVLNTIYAPLEMAFVDASFVCEGDSLHANLTQTGLAPYQYSWSTGDQFSGPQTSSTIPLLTSGMYSVTITDALGFSVTDSIYVAEPQPEPIAIAGIDIQGLTVYFSDSSLHADDWLWDLGDGNLVQAASVTHYYAAAGPYEARLIVSNDCGTDTLVFPLFLTTGIEEVEESRLEVSPNPFSQQTHIRFDNPSQEAFQLIVTDVQGREVRKIEGIRSSEITLDREGLGTGIYLFQLNSGRMRYAGKLMIQ